MDNECVDIFNHDIHLQKLPCYHENHCPAFNANISESIFYDMKRRFAHTFFHPNQHENEYRCKCHGMRCAN